MKKNIFPIRFYKYLLLLFPKQFREHYFSEMALLVSEEYSTQIQAKKNLFFWIWLISDYLTSLIAFYLIGGNRMKENKFLRFSARIFIFFGSYTIFLTGLSFIRNSQISINSEFRRIIGIFPWYSDFFVYLLFFIGSLGLVIFFNNKNLYIPILLCVPILLAASFKIINTISVMFSGPIPEISNFGLYFISIGMLFIGIILLWKNQVSFLQFLPYLLIGFPLLPLVFPLNVLAHNLVFGFSKFFFGVGWILIGREILSWIKGDIHLVPIQSAH